MAVRHRQIVLKRKRQAGQNRVPAFEGMSGISYRVTPVVRMISALSSGMPSPFSAEVTMTAG